jgi:lysyl-tRNA synthetase class 2
LQEVAAKVSVLNALKAKLATASGEPPLPLAVPKAAPAPAAAKSKAPNGKRSEASAAAAAAEGPAVEVPVREVRASRIDKAEAMRRAGVNPFAYAFQPTHSARALAAEFGHLANGAEDASGAAVRLAGRVLTRRSFGKLMFFTCQDESGAFQLYVDEARLGSEAFQQLKVYDSRQLSASQKRETRNFKWLACIYSLPIDHVWAFWSEERAGLVSFHA